MMSFLEVNSSYQDSLLRHRLKRAEDFLRLGGVILCGHPDRNVARITIGTGKDALHAYLKREHHVRVRDRLASATAGFGFVSKSRREWTTCRFLRQSGLSCPDVIAVGESDGRAFLLIKAVDRAADLSSVLRQNRAASKRRRLICQLGQALARIHDAGLDQPDLYSKHILVEERRGDYYFWFLDWQRSCRRHQVPWSVRCRDLAALDATVLGELADDRERLLCLTAYLRATRRSNAGVPSPLARSLAGRIRVYTATLRRRRYIREMLQAPLRSHEQGLLWFGGEAVCMTPAFATLVGSDSVRWVEFLRTEPGKSFERQQVALPDQRCASLTRRRNLLDWQRLCNGLRGKRSATPEVEQAATIFRLQRHGIAVPELLAFGHQQRFCRSVSFLLTESLEAADMGDWLSFSHDTVHRRHVLRQAGDILRRLHIAGYRLEARTNPLVFFAVQAAPEGPRVVLRSADGVYRQEKFDRSRHGGLGHDLERLQSCFSLLCSEAEIAAFLSSYLQRARNIGTMDHGLRTTDVSCGSAA